MPFELRDRPRAARFIFIRAAIFAAIARVANCSLPVHCGSAIGIHPEGPPHRDVGSGVARGGVRLVSTSPAWCARRVPTRGAVGHVRPFDEDGISKPVPPTEDRRAYLDVVMCQHVADKLPRYRDLLREDGAHHDAHPGTSCSSSGTTAQANSR